MITEFFTVSGYLFWIGLLIIVLAEVIFLTKEEDEVAITLALVASGIVVFFSDAMRDVPLIWFAYALPVYFVIGVLWAIKKWRDHVIAELERARDNYKIVNKSATGNETFEKYAARFRPSAADKKARIVNWMALWPFSVSWWLLSWPRRAFVWVYERIATIFDRITDRFFAPQ